MTNFTAKTFLLFVTAAAAINPNSSLRAASRILHKANANVQALSSIPNRKLQNSPNARNGNRRELQATSSPTLVSGTFTPSFPGPTVDPELCREATALELGSTAVEGTVTGPEGMWYSITATTDGYLAFTTCTGDEALDTNALDTIINVYSGSCDELVSEAYDDDSGSCGNLKSSAYFSAVSGETYYVNVSPLSYSAELDGLGFGLVAAEADVPANAECTTAIAVELGTPVEGETSTFGNGLWYSVIGTGTDLRITTCTGESALDDNDFDSVIEVYAKDCDDLRLIQSDDEGGKCGNGKSAVILPSVDGLIYQIHVYAYLGGTGSFGLVVSENA